MKPHHHDKMTTTIHKTKMVSGMGKEPSYRERVTRIKTNLGSEESEESTESAEVAEPKAIRGRLQLPRRIKPTKGSKTYSRLPDSKQLDHPRGAKKPKDSSEEDYFKNSHESSDSSENGASELEDLANDQFFYEQLERNKPSTESSADVEHVTTGPPKVNREVVFIHHKNANDGNRIDKHREKLLDSFDEDKMILAAIEADIYSDYGDMEMDMEKKDVEMYESADKNTKESRIQSSTVQYTTKREPLHKKESTVQATIKPNAKLVEKARDQKRRRTIYIHRPSENSDSILITKKLTTPDELHAEINKIFALKNKNYNKRGHDKTHWELRIIPQPNKDALKTSSDRKI